MTQAVKISGDVKEHLLPGENVIRRVATSAGASKEFYITDKRLIGLARSEMWVGLFGLLGMMAKKGLIGAVELNRLTAIQLKSQRSGVQVGMGIFLGLVFIGMGIPFTTIEGAAGFGVFFVILGLVLGGFLALMKQSYWQFEITGLQASEMKKWRVYRPLASRGKIDDVIQGMATDLPEVKISR